MESEQLQTDRDPLLRALSVPSNIRDQRVEPVAESNNRQPLRPANRRLLSGQQVAEEGEEGGDRNSKSDEVALAGPAGSEHLADKLIGIVFDGGSRGNPGQGYGSFALDWHGSPREVVQLKFGDKDTNNEAEYDTLIAALETVRDRVVKEGTDPDLASLNIRGDSLLVCNQVQGKWKCKEPRLQSRLKKVKALIRIFGSVDLGHHPREKSVEILGH